MNMQLTINDLQPQDTHLEPGIAPANINDILEHYNNQARNRNYFSNSVLENLNLLLDSYPLNIALLMRRSWFYETRSMHEEALADLALILNHNPGHKKALFNRARIFSDKERYDEALIDLNQLLSDNAFVS